MFTGIVQGCAELVRIEELADLRRHWVRMPRALLEGLRPGASVAHNGCCLTVVAIKDDIVQFDLVPETLKLTNLASLQVGAQVNIERAARLGDEIGGHLMSGHILCQATLTKRIVLTHGLTLWFRLSPSIMRYVLTKGFIAVDGVSLTVGQVRDQSFCVHLIPETVARTTLGARRVKDRVNIEVDVHTQAIVDTVERVLHEKSMTRPLIVKGP